MAAPKILRYQPGQLTSTAYTKFARDALQYGSHERACFQHESQKNPELNPDCVACQYAKCACVVTSPEYHPFLCERCSRRHKPCSKKRTFLVWATVETFGVSKEEAMRMYNRYGQTQRARVPKSLVRSSRPPVAASASLHDGADLEVEVGSREEEVMMVDSSDSEDELGESGVRDDEAEDNDGSELDSNSEDGRQSSEDIDNPGSPHTNTPRHENPLSALLHGPMADRLLYQLEAIYREHTSPQGSIATMERNNIEMQHDIREMHGRVAAINHSLNLMRPDISSLQHAQQKWESRANSMNEMLQQIHQTCRSVKSKVETLNLEVGLVGRYAQPQPAQRWGVDQRSEYAAHYPMVGPGMNMEQRRYY